MRSRLDVVKLAAGAASVGQAVPQNSHKTSGALSIKRVAFIYILSPFSDMEPRALSSRGRNYSLSDRRPPQQYYYINNLRMHIEAGRTRKDH